MALLSQLPDDVDLSFVAGDTFRIRIRVIDPADGSAIEINPDADEPNEEGEYAFRAQIVKDPERTFASEFLITADPQAPTTAVILTLPPTETAVLPGMGNGTEFKGMWDLEVTFPNGDVRTVAKGSVICYLDITNSASSP